MDIDTDTSATIVLTMGQLQNAILIGILQCMVGPSLASTPNVIVSVGGNKYMAKRGLFGSKKDVTGELVLAPEFDPHLCLYNASEEAFPPSSDSIMLVPRGGCSFEQKAYAAKQFGVVGVLIYDNMASRYGWDSEKEAVVFPRDQWDYECDNGYGTMENLDLDPPRYNATLLDPILGEGCTLTPTRNPCDSNICMVTSHAKNSTDYAVCCAWDLPMTMGGDGSIDDSLTDDVTAVFLTIRQANDILPLAAPVGTGGGEVATIMARERSNFNVSFLFLFVMGIFSTVFGAWYATREYRDFGRKLEEYKAKQGVSEGGTDNEFGITEEDDVGDELNSDGGNDSSFLDETNEPAKKGGMFGWAKNFGGGKKDQEPLSLRSIPPARYTEKKEPEMKSGKQDDGSWVLYSIPPQKKDKNKNKKKAPTPDDNAINMATRQVTTQTRAQKDGEDLDSFIPEGSSSATMSTELSQWHVFGFVASASIMLVLLFYFRFFSFIFVVYALGCAGAVSYLIIGPILVRIIPRLGDQVVTELNKEVCCRQNGFDVTSQLGGFIWSGVWIWYGLSHYQPLHNWFFWITQDIFGMTVAIMFLGALKLYSIRIATWFLVAVFFYDIFFVFITPFFTSNGESVMLSVVGDSDTIVDDFCFKYPESSDCTGITSLPMILTFPHINDWTGGSAILGLGDILLPGFLVSYTARVDAAARLLGRHTSVDVYVPEKWYQGYFFPLSVAYAIGLLITFSVLWATGDGQPALLYLAPSCLLAMFIVGRKEIKELWTDSRTLRLADNLKRKCEKNWARQRMHRQVMKKRRERAGYVNNDNDVSGPDSAPARQQMDRPGGSRGSNPSSRGNPNERRSRSRGADGRRNEDRRNPGRREGRRGHPKDGSRNTDQTTGQSNNRGAKKSPGSNAAKAAPDNNAARAEPQKGDVCLGNEKHPGTKALRRAAQKSLETFSNDDFNPDVYRSIKRQLKGKEFFVRDGTGWRQASKGEIKRGIEKAFNEAK
eukprot:scaffold1697_cov120-Cylindrotheca_fusiformis.AAC.7